MKKKLTPRQRVLTALRHEVPDRVPLDFGSTMNTGITRYAYERLKKYLKLEFPTEMLVPSMSIARIDDAVLERFNIDTRGVWTGGSDIWKDKYISQHSYINEFGLTYYKSPNSYFYEVTDGPFRKDFSSKSLKEFLWPDPNNRGRVRGIRQRVNKLREYTDYAIVLHAFGGFITASQNMRGLDNWLADTILEPDLLGELLDYTLHFQMELTLNALQEAEFDVDIVHFGDDLGMQTGLMFSPEIYRKIIKPRQARLFGIVKKNTDAKIMYHSCGSNYSILNDLIEVGVDAYNPLQTNAAGMDAAKLKAEFNGRLSFWGGIDTHTVLNHAGITGVKNEVKKKIEILAPNGGYVLNAVHNIQPDVPPENICAMFDAALEYGQY